jgi:hypothetical protein
VGDLSATLAAHVHATSLAWGRRSYACDLIVATLEDGGSSSSGGGDGSGGGGDGADKEPEEKQKGAEIEEEKKEEGIRLQLPPAAKPPTAPVRAQLHVVTSHGTWFRCVRAYALGGGDGDEADESSEDSGSDDADNDGAVAAAEALATADGATGSDARNKSDSRNRSSTSASSTGSSSTSASTTSSRGGGAALRLALVGVDWGGCDATRGGAALDALLLAAAHVGYAADTPTAGRPRAPAGLQGAEAAAGGPGGTPDEGGHAPPGSAMGLDHGVLQWGRGPGKEGMGATWTQRTSRCECGLR